MNQPLRSLNIPSDIITKLESAGFHYCDEIVGTPDFPTAWGSVLETPTAKTALQLCEEETKFDFPGISIPKLDPLLKTVIQPGCITEFCGAPGAGKTQICLHLAVGMQDVIFIHTNNNLNVERLKELCTDDILEKIYCIEATDDTELLASLYFLENLLQNCRCKAVIIDSISWVLKQVPVLERSSNICTILQCLRSLANKHSLSIVVTNDLTKRVYKEESVLVSCFGETFYHLVNNRVLLSKENSGFKAEVLKSVGGHHDVVSFTL